MNIGQMMVPINSTPSLQFRIKALHSLLIQHEWRFNIMDYNWVLCISANTRFHAAGQKPFKNTSLFHRTCLHYVHTTRAFVQGTSRFCRLLFKWKPWISSLQGSLHHSWSDSFCTGMSHTSCSSIWIRWEGWFSGVSLWPKPLSGKKVSLTDKTSSGYFDEKRIYVDTGGYSEQLQWCLFHPVYGHKPAHACCTDHSFPRKLDQEKYRSAGVRVF